MFEGGGREAFEPLGHFSSHYFQLALSDCRQISFRLCSDLVNTTSPGANNPSVYMSPSDALYSAKYNQHFLFYADDSQKYLSFKSGKPWQPKMANAITTGCTFEF